MDELNQLKTMIDTLQRRRLGVGKQIAEFKVLQTEIAALYARAESCPDAIQKLKKLDGVLGTSNGIAQQMVEKVVEMKKSFEQLGRQLRQLAPEPDDNVCPADAASNAAPASGSRLKKHQRSFA